MDNSSRRRAFAAGTIIFHEGDAGSEAYIVESGRVSVYKTVKDRRIDIGEVKTGGIFGEMALIDDHPRMATAVAEEATVCVMVAKDRLTEQLEKAPRGVRVIVGALLGNIRLMGTELAETLVNLANSDRKP
jgi:CRP-like cAMP-binding protein